MTKKEHLLTVVMEECAEIQQAVSKALRFGMDGTNPCAGTGATNEENVLTEYYQLQAVFSLLFENHVLREPDVARQKAIINAKVAKLKKYMGVSQKRGYMKE